MSPGEINLDIWQETKFLSKNNTPIYTLRKNPGSLYMCSHEPKKWWIGEKVTSLGSSDKGSANGYWGVGVINFPKVLTGTSPTEIIDFVPESHFNKIHYVPLPSKPSPLLAEDQEGKSFTLNTILGEFIFFDHGGSTLYCCLVEDFEDGLGGTSEYGHGKTRVESLVSCMRNLGFRTETILRDDFVIENKEENIMNEKKDRVGLAKDQAKNAGKSLLAGAGMATIDVSGDLMLDFAKDKFGDSPFMQMALSTNEGRELIKLVLAYAIQGIAYQTDLPKADMVISITDQQLKLSGYKVLAPHLKDLMSLMLSLGSLAEKMDNDPVAAFMPSNSEVEEILSKVSAAQEVKV